MTSFGDLLNQLHNDDDPRVQEDAIVRVVGLATKYANRWETPEFLLALEGIVRLLLNDGRPGTQTYAAWALANLSAAHGPQNKENVALFPQVLVGLVRLLSEAHRESSAQEEAVRALRNLACAQENSHTISLFPDAVPALLELLFDDSQPGPQIQATMAVLNLIGNAMASLEGIDGADEGGGDGAEFPGVLKCLVRLWFSDISSTRQAEAVWAIIALVERTLVNPDVSAKDGNMQRIADFPDALLLLLGSFMTDSG